MIIAEMLFVPCERLCACVEVSLSVYALAAVFSPCEV